MPRLGQHFLRDPDVLERIVDSLGPCAGRTVVEIGPGQGVLTARLLESGARVVAIEVDPRLASDLRRRFDTADFELIEADVLRVDLAKLADGPVTIVGNLPYYITSPIVRKTLEAAECFEQAVFLMQREVARRVCAHAGNRDYGYLSVLCRLRSEPELLFAVPREAFRPPPKVHSAVVRLVPRATEIPEGLDRFLQAAFRQPRKTLLNNLSALYPRDQVATSPQAAKRAQQLSVSELRELWKTLAAQQTARSA